MDEDEIKGFWENLPMLREPLSSVFKVLLLLGQRKGETCRMKWNDIEDGIWTIPKDETKANRKHLVPLPPLAVEIIEDLENDSPFVFESRINKGKPVKWINEAFDRVTGEAKITDARIHDLRRTCATHLSGLGTDRTTLGKLLNHKGLSGDSQVTARYDRYGYMDEKRTALNKWSIGLYGIIKEADYNSLQKGF
ncbi:MAG: site-specific integrase, partial [Candidatus Halalkalibacterium sp. M3_1C_030]